MSRKESGSLEAINASLEEFPNSKTLLISSKRPRTFLIRTARELLAGGTEVLVLCALGDAMPLCIQLQMSLVVKKAATTIKIETSLNKCTNSRGKAPNYTPGLRIYMRRHPDFKGSRISPGYVFFAPKPVETEFTPPYEALQAERICSVCSGAPDLAISGPGIGEKFAELLKNEEQDLDAYQKLFKTLLEELQAAHQEDPEVFISTMANSAFTHPDLKFALCRLPRDSTVFNGVNEGIVFVAIFKDKFPYKQPNNMGCVYVVPPNGKNYDDVEKFHEAVYETGENLMTALCDYNGMAKRDAKRSLQRMNSCRTCLFSGGIFIHKQSDKHQVATNIINGLADGYRHGPSPRLVFAYDEDAFKKSWCETTGFVVQG